MRAVCVRRLPFTPMEEAVLVPESRCERDSI
jgi:hypothetical protein